MSLIPRSRGNVDVRLTKSGNARCKQLLMMPKEHSQPTENGNQERSLNGLDR